MNPDGERRALVALSFMARPGDPVLGEALRARTATEVLALVSGADADGEALLAGEAEDVALHRSVQRWRDRLGENHQSRFRYSGDMRRGSSMVSSSTSVVLPTLS